MVLNNRLSMYLNEKDLLGEEQVGFREGYSTLDHIFSLNCIIDLISQKKHLYCAIVDYRKAFDTVNRSSLLLKLLKFNIGGKVLTVIRKSAKSCVRVSSNTSNLFSCNVGVRQGENPSPLLFAIYLNDLEKHFEGTCQGVTQTATNLANESEVLLKLLTLLYADDTILFSESVPDLQNMLTTLHPYCQQWQLTVNISKTKVVVFSKGKIRNLPKLLYGEEPLDVQFSYTYLGVLFNYNGSYVNAMKKQISQAKGALFALLAKARKIHLPLDLQCHLFDSCIVPILLYECEVWGFFNLQEIERVQTYFGKYSLHLSTQTSNCIVLGELGRQRLQCLIKQKMVNFWSQLITVKASKISCILFYIITDKRVSGNYTSKWLT